MGNLILKQNSLHVEDAAQNSSKSYSTAITDAMIVEVDKLKISVRRPTTGTGNQYGGTAYVFDENGNVVTTQKVPGFNSPTEAIIQNSKLDFTSQSYLIGYGPNNVDQGVNATAATVRVDSGEVFDFNSSRCFMLNVRNNRVTARYSVPSEFTDIKSMRMYLVEGSSLKDSNAAISGVIHKFDSSSASHGTVNLSFNSGTLEIGKTYTICLNVYSWTREIAGQTFTFK